MMSTNMEWRRCKHCDRERFCTPQAMYEHEEDCPKRPSQVSKLCPKCGFVLVKTVNCTWLEYVCSNYDCKYELTMMPGGKA